MSVRDADWLAYDHLRVVGPLRGVTAEQIRATLVELHRRHRDHPSVCAIDPVARRWVPSSPADYARLVEQDVAESPPGPDPAAAVLAALLAAPLAGRPLRVVVCGDFVGIRMSHGVGDGRVFNALVPELFGAGAAQRPPRLAFRRPSRLPLAKAALRYFGRDPRRLGRLATVPRPVLPQPPAEQPRRPWHPDLATYYRRSDGDLVASVRAWRDRELPGVSAAAVLFAATFLAFDEAGLGSENQGVMVLVDARRYLSKSATVDGNFAAAQYLLPADPRDPRAIYEAMGAAVSAGRPLTSLGLRDLLAWRGRHTTPAPPDSVRVHPHPELSLTHIGRMDGYGRLPWAVPAGERQFISAPTPGGPEGVTISFAEMGGAIHLNTAFHRSTFAEEPVRRAIDLVCADPVTLLAAARQGGQLIPPEHR